jgi:hypothetical protein
VICCRNEPEGIASHHDYEGIEYAIRAGLGRNEWVLLISFPDNVGGNPSVVNFSGTWTDALAESKKRIVNWVRRLARLFVRRMRVRQDWQR